MHSFRASRKTSAKQSGVGKTARVLSTFSSCWSLSFSLAISKTTAKPRPSTSIVTPAGQAEFHNSKALANIITYAFLSVIKTFTCVGFKRSSIADAGLSDNIFIAKIRYVVTGITEFIAAYRMSLPTKLLKSSTATSMLLSQKGA
jgi:hypothetical protein